MKAKASICAFATNWACWLSISSHGLVLRGDPVALTSGRIVPCHGAGHPIQTTPFATLLSGRRARSSAARCSIERRVSMSTGVQHASGRTRPRAAAAPAAHPHPRGAARPLPIVSGALHAASLVHRDTRPENISISNGKSIFLDPGVAEDPQASVRLTQVTTGPIGAPDLGRRVDKKLMRRRRAVRSGRAMALLARLAPTRELALKRPTRRPWERRSRSGSAAHVSSRESEAAR